MNETNQHCDAVRKIAENDVVLLTLDDGDALDVTCVRREQIHSSGDSPGIWTETQLTFEDMNVQRYTLGYIDGLSPVEGGEDAYPAYFPVVDEQLNDDSSRVPEEALLGYVVEVEWVEP